MFEHAKHVMGEVVLPGMLPPPAAVVIDGHPASGRYAGLVARIEWAGLCAAQQHSAWWRRLHHKRWQYVGIGSEEVFIGVAIVDLGWGCSSFAYVFDRRTRQMLTDWSQEGLPGLSGQVGDAPVRGAQAVFRGWRSRVALRYVADAARSAEALQAAPGEGLRLSVDVPGLRLEAALALSTAPPWLLAVGPIKGGAAHATQKSPALSMVGWAEACGQRFALDGAVASVDSSNGLLAHHTAWRWACAHRPGLGFNLQQGYFGSHENVLWLDGALIALGAAQFEFDATQPLQPWRVHTDDGRLDLRFTPEGARQADIDLGVVASHYVQPVGTFEGWVRAAPADPPRPVQGLLGVTEDHRSAW